MISSYSFHILAIAFFRVYRQYLFANVIEFHWTFIFGLPCVVVLCLLFHFLVIVNCSGCQSGCFRFSRWPSLLVRMSSGRTTAESGRADRLRACQRLGHFPRSPSKTRMGWQKWENKASIIMAMMSKRLKCILIIWFVFCFFPFQVVIDLWQLFNNTTTTASLFLSAWCAFFKPPTHYLPWPSCKLFRTNMLLSTQPLAPLSKRITASPSLPDTWAARWRACLPMIMFSKKIWSTLSKLKSWVSPTRSQFPSGVVCGTL